MSGFKIPWLEIDLPKESIVFLWDTISDTDSHTDARKG